MKKILFAVLALATMASCSNEYTVEMDREAIAFGDAFVNNSTRANDPSYSANKIPSFLVWGTVKAADDSLIPLFVADEVKSTNNSEEYDYGDAWYCTNIQYWIYGATYDFAAVVGATEADVTLANERPSKVKYTANGDNDLLYAEALDQVREKTTTDKLVKFAFEHLVSKVTVKAINTTSEPYYFVLKNITMNTPSSGDVAVPAKTWDNFGEMENLAFDAIGTAVAPVGTTAVESANSKLVVPYTYNSTNDQLVVKFDAEWYYKVGGTYKLVATNTGLEVKGDVTMEPGYAYNLTIQYGLNDTIQFTVDRVDGFGNNGSANTTLQ